MRFINTNTKFETMLVNFIIDWKHIVGFPEIKYKDNLLDKQIYETLREGFRFQKCSLKTKCRTFKYANCINKIVVLNELLLSGEKGNTTVELIFICSDNSIR